MLGLTESEWEHPILGSLATKTPSCSREIGRGRSHRPTVGLQSWTRRSPWPRGPQDQVLLHEAVLDVPYPPPIPCASFSNPFCFLVSASAQGGIDSFLGRFVSGKGMSLPSFTLAGSSWSLAVVSSTLSFCSLRQKFRGLYGTGKYLGPEKPGALGSFAWAVL